MSFPSDAADAGAVDCRTGVDVLRYTSCTFLDGSNDDDDDKPALGSALLCLAAGCGGVAAAEGAALRAAACCCGCCCCCCCCCCRRFACLIKAWTCFVSVATELSRADSRSFVASVSTAASPADAPAVSTSAAAGPAAPAADAEASARSLPPPLPLPAPPLRRRSSSRCARVHRSGFASTTRLSRSGTLLMKAANPARSAAALWPPPRAGSCTTNGIFFLSSLHGALFGSVAGWQTGLRRYWLAAPRCMPAPPSGLSSTPRSRCREEKMRAGVHRTSILQHTTPVCAF